MAGTAPHHGREGMRGTSACFAQARVPAMACGPGADVTLAEAVRGIDLPRLLDLARLTPAHAVVLAADALTAAPARPPAPAAGEVGPDGRARLRATAGRRADSPADPPDALLE